MLKAVVFDYNGTLVDDLGLHEEAYWRAGRERGYTLTRDTVRRHISQPPSRKRILYYGQISDAEWAEIIELRKKIYCDLAPTGFRLFAHTEDVLVRLSGRCRLGVLSNTFRGLFERLFPPRLAALFEASLFFDEVPDPKPSPAPMRKMLSLLGVEPNECGYVGDAVEDICMARAAGVRSYSVATGSCTAAELQAAGADWVGADLAALCERLWQDASPENA
jgi:HAD superfamily hydrolase (TIGR01509 family)